MSKKTFASLLKQLREAAGLTQPQLAERAGMNQFGIAKLEQGVREPTWATVRTLAKALGVNCLAFDIGDEPAVEEPAKPRGRPRKDTSAATAEPAPKKGKKRKG